MISFFFVSCDHDCAVNVRSFTKIPFSEITILFVRFVFLVSRLVLMRMCHASESYKYLPFLAILFGSLVEISFLG